MNINAVASNCLILEKNSIFHIWKWNAKRFQGIFHRIPNSGCNENGGSGQGRKDSWNINRCKLIYLIKNECTTFLLVLLM